MERGGPPQLVNLAHRLGDLDPALLAELLLIQCGAEERRRQDSWLHGLGMQERWQVKPEIRLDVVPGFGNILLGQQIFVLVTHCLLLRMIRERSGNDRMRWR